MSLVLYSKFGLEKLEELAHLYFSPIWDFEVPIRDFKSESPYDHENLGFLYRVIPTGEFDELEFMFKIPFSRDKVLNSP